MSVGIRYRIGRWLEDNPITRRLVLRFEGIGPTGKHLYTNRVGGWMIAKETDQ